MTRKRWGALRKLPSGRWQASYIGLDGARYVAPVTYTAKADAEGWLAKAHASIATETWKAPKVAQAESFGSYARTWVEQRRSSKGAPLRPRTKAEYLRELSRGLSVFGRDQLTAITPARVRQWHHKRSTEAGATMAGAEARLLRAIMSTAVTDGIISSNPVPSTLARSSTGQAHRPPTAAELGVILAEIDPKFRLAIVLAAVGGLRIGEWKALRRSDVVRREDGRFVVTISRQVQYVGHEWHVGPPKSSAGVRTWVAPDAISAEIEQHLSERVSPFPASLLFAPTGGAEYLHDSTFRFAWDKARDVAGVRGIVREHDLRAFALTSFAQTGATLAELQRFGGHANVTSAMAYQHAAQGRIDDLSNQVAPLPTTAKRTAPVAHL